jgi:hypothetical protein
VENNYQEHCENLRMLEQGYVAVERTLKGYISKRDKHRTIAFTRLLSLIIDSWIEVRLMKLLHELNAYSEIEKQKILHARTFEDQWLKALEVAYNKAFLLNDNSPESKTAIMQYFSLKNAIIGDIKQSRELRNRIAHGQWRFAFNGDCTRLNLIITEKLEAQNILSLKFKLELFRILAQIIHDLAVSPETFSRDFEKNYRIILNQKRNGDQINYQKYIEKLALSYENSKKKRFALHDENH